MVSDKGTVLNHSVHFINSAKIVCPVCPVKNETGISVYPQLNTVQVEATVIEPLSVNVALLVALIRIVALLYCIYEIPDKVHRGETRLTAPL